MINSYRNVHTGVIINHVPGISYTTANNVPIPYWYMELNPINSNDWTPIQSWEITAVKNICICGHNGQTYNKETETIYEITRYPDNTVFKIGDNVTNGEQSGEISEFTLYNGEPIVLTDNKFIGLNLMSIKHVTAPKIDERVYWSVIDSIGWGRKSTDYKQISQELETIYSAEFLHALKEFVLAKRKELQQHLVNAFKGDGTNVYKILKVSDDGFYDLTAHIVGLGESTYQMVIEHPSYISGIQYKENFEYIFH